MATDLRPGTYFLVGPTASGKTAVAQWIAERYDCDILSADSLLVYQGMDIGTAKPTQEERRRVRYYGLDLVTPDQQYSVWNYRVYALDVLRAARLLGRRVIVVGGTGLYIKSLSHGLRETPGPCPTARFKWEKILERDGIEALQLELRTVAPELFESLPDKRNPRRLIRALELAGRCSRPLQPTWSYVAPVTPLVGLALASALHTRAIEVRVEKMYSKGIVEEVRALLIRYPSWCETARRAIGYAEVLELIAGKCTREEAVARTVRRTRLLAKRQRTWFRHQANVEWVPVTEESDVEDVAHGVLSAWSRHGPTEIV